MEMYEDQVGRAGASGKEKEIPEDLYRGDSMEEKAKRKIKLRIAGSSITVMSTDSEEYSKDLAARMDKCIKQICRSTVTSVSDATLLVALNYCDGMQKAKNENAELKIRLDACVKELEALKASAAALEKENDKLRTEADICRAMLRTETLTAAAGRDTLVAVPITRQSVLRLESAVEELSSGKQLADTRTGRSGRKGKR